MALIIDLQFGPTSGGSAMSNTVKQGFDLAKSTLLSKANTAWLVSHLPATAGNIIVTTYYDGLPFTDPNNVVHYPATAITHGYSTGIVGGFDHSAWKANLAVHFASHGITYRPSVDSVILVMPNEYNALLNNTYILTSAEGPAVNYDFARLLFHELAHAASVSDLASAKKFSLGNASLADPWEADTIAIAAENIIYRQDHGGGIGGGHGGLSTTPVFGAVNAFDALQGSPRLEMRPVDGQLAAVFTETDDDQTATKIFFSRGFDPRGTDLAKLNHYIINEIHQDGGVIEADGTLATLLNTSLNGDSASSDVASKVAAVTETLIDLNLFAQQVIAADQAPDWFTDLMKNLPNADQEVSRMISLETSSINGSAGHQEVVGPQQADANIANAGPAAYLSLAATHGIATVLIGGAGFDQRNVNFETRLDDLQGYNRGDLLIGGDGLGSTTSPALRNMLAGDDGDDIIVSGSGKSTVLGGRDSDLILVGSGGTLIDGGLGKDLIAFADRSTSGAFDLTQSQNGYCVATQGDNVSLFKSIEVYLGGDAYTFFVGNRTGAVFVAGEGGGDFTMTRGDTAFGHAGVKDIFRVTTNAPEGMSAEEKCEYLKNNKIMISNFESGDEIWVDGVKFDGNKCTSVIAQMQSVQPNGDEVATALHMSTISSWGTDIPLSHFEVRATNDASYVFNDGPLTVRNVVYSVADESGMGVIEFYQRTAHAVGTGALSGLEVDELAPDDAQLTIVIDGFTNGMGGISFTQDPLSALAYAGFGAPNLPGVFNGGFFISPGEASDPTRIPVNVLLDVLDGTADGYVSEGATAINSDDPLFNYGHMPFEGQDIEWGDFISGGAVINGDNSADDSITGGGGNDDIYGYGGADIISGASGDDVLYGGEGDDLLDGGAGDDVLYGEGGDDTLIGGDGEDELIGGAGDDSLAGGDGEDILQGEAGDDLVDGGAGEDVARFAGISADYAITQEADGSIRVEDKAGDEGIDILTGVEALRFDQEGTTYHLGVPGTAGADTRTGTWESDALFGMEGDDILKGAGGSDILHGGAGMDTAEYEGPSTDFLIFNDPDGTLHVIADEGDEGGDRLVEIETLTFAGDEISINVADVAPLGTAGDDVIAGSERRDSLFGLDGNDVLDGLAGDDRLFGGGGNDVYHIGAGSDFAGDDAGGDDLYVYAGNGDAIVMDDGGADALDLSGINPNDVRVQLTGGGTSYLITFGNAPGSIYLASAVNAATAIEEVRFYGGTYVWTSSTLAALAANTGSDGDDVMQGTAAGESLYGMAGNDVIDGRGGNDTIYGGLGDDVMSGSGGNDQYVVNWGDGNDVIADFVSAASGSGGNDTLKFGPGFLLSDLSVGYTPDGASYILYFGGGEQHTTILNMATGGLGSAHWIETIRFSDTGAIPGIARPGAYLAAMAIAGMTMDDDVLTASGPAGATLRGLGGDDVLNGSAVDNVLKGDGGSDILFGNDGSDTLDGGAGVDEMTGGLGDDFYVVDDTGDLVIEAVAEGTDEVRSSAGTYALADNVENLSTRMTTGQFLTGNDLDNVITGWVGDDTLDGADGDDILNGIYGNDTLYGGAGNDVLMGGGGFTILVGGTGNDELTAGSIVRFARGDGDDVIVYGFIVLEFAAGIAPSDVTVTQSGLDIILTIDSGGGTIRLLDALVPYSGPNGALIRFDDETEWTFGDAVDLSLTATAGDDTLLGDDRDNVIYGGDGNDTLDGGKGDDDLYGGSGADTLIGLAGWDTLHGDDGADLLIGAGTTVMAGGSGTDTFRIESSAGGGPSIDDFVSGVDSIDLAGLDADLNQEGNQAFTFIGDAAFSGAAGELRYWTDSEAGFTIIQADMDGDGASDFSIWLTGQPGLVATDFIL